MNRRRSAVVFLGVILVAVAAYTHIVPSGTQTIEGYRVTDFDYSFNATNDDVRFGTVLVDRIATSQSPAVIQPQLHITANHTVWLHSGAMHPFGQLHATGQETTFTLWNHAYTHITPGLSPGETPRMWPAVAKVKRYNASATVSRNYMIYPEKSEVTPERYTITGDIEYGSKLGQNESITFTITFTLTEDDDISPVAS